MTFSTNLTHAIRTPSFTDVSQTCNIRVFNCDNFPHNSPSPGFLHLQVKTSPEQGTAKTYCEAAGKWGGGGGGGEDYTRRNKSG